MLTWGRFCKDEKPPEIRLSIVPANVDVLFATMGIKYMLEIAQECRNADISEDDFPCCFAIRRAWDRNTLVRHDVLKKALIEADVIAPSDFTWVFDTRMFHDAGDSRQLCKHVGSNEDIVQGIVQHRRFPQFLDSLWYAWDMISRNLSKGSQVRIVMYCKSGRHRSVAAALIAHHLFQTTRGLPVPQGTVHLCSQWWAFLCPRNCPQCTQQSHIRDAALQKAREMWKELLERKEQ